MSVVLSTFKIAIVLKCFQLLTKQVYVVYILRLIVTRA